MARDHSVVLQPVVVVSEGVALTFDYDGRRYDVPLYDVKRASNVSVRGDRGRLVISRDTADRIGLP
jgi:hypothetical protein